MELDLSQCLIARKGEVITCPDCGADLAEAAADITFAARPWPLTFFADTVKLPNGSIVCLCGGRPTKSGSRAKRRATESARPRVHLRHGWRELGGEAS
jgi:hypothetical protein